MQWYRSASTTRRFTFSSFRCVAIRVLSAGALAAGVAQGSARAATETAEEKIAKTSTEHVALPAVIVRAQALEGLPPVLPGGQLASGAHLGLLGNQNVMDVPFSVTSYTSQRIQDAQASTLAEVLGNDASTRFTGQIGGVSDSFYIRGFPINEGNLSEIAFDGVYGVSPNYHLFTEYIERVEVLKGPAALLYGMSPMGGVGGVVNVVPKRPINKDITRFTLDYASDSQGGVAMDVSRRFGSERQLGFRFNGLRRQGGTPLDNQSSRAAVGAWSFDYQGERFRATLDMIEQYQWVNAPTRPFLVAPTIQVPAAPNGSRNITQSWAWWKANEMATLLHAEYDINNAVTVFADAGGAKSDVARFSDQTPTILDALGNTLSTPHNLKFQVNRWSADTGLRARFATGPAKHAVAIQASVYRDRVASANNSGAPIASNIYAPVSSPEPDVPAPPRVPKVSASTLVGVAIADTLSFIDERLQLTLGVRQQHVQSENFDRATGVRTASYNKNALTPLAGILMKPLSNISIYANYVEGLSKGDIAPAVASNAGQVFAPYKTKQHEVGIKADFDRMQATLAAFRITKPSGQLSGTTFAVNSEQRNQGLEFTVSGEPANGIRILGGVTWIDATLTKTNDVATQGKRPVGVPSWMANASAQWDVPWVGGITLTGGLNFTGREYVDQANTQSVASWTTFDFGAQYRKKVYGKWTTWRAGVLNAFNRDYWSGVASFGTISLGAPRTVFMSASVDI
ncbi:MAG TPA: TonB-dependent siderophore receptor [Trinickia sp.]|jgi:iron complex outermembrane receptor protein|uniref:TonB-dependent receptor n=1 Tax=Trinickia sp. TaxID=2571163 RepID=UPI002C1321EB|nr:TonB-dependent siderophore receptor [Trinickia sp.]HTI18035.1 TonB-dependent siderophore receptor [Trinickia sp.]